MCSVDSAVLQSRTADPEELLYNLGFGGSDQLARSALIGQTATSCSLPIGQDPRQVPAAQVRGPRRHRGVLHRAAGGRGHQVLYAVLCCTVLYCTVLYCTVDTRVEFGFAGYRGLHGSPSRRPSEIVEKILHTLVSWVWHGAAADVLAVFDDVWKKPLHWDACLQVVSNSSL